MAAPADFGAGEAPRHQLGLGGGAQVEAGEMEARETLGEGGDRCAELGGGEVRAMHATRAMAVATGEIEGHAASRRDDVVQFPGVTTLIKFAARDRDLVQPDQLLQGLLAVAAHDDVLLLHQRHDPTVVQPRVAAPDDLELQPRDELLEEEVLLRAPDKRHQTGLVADETQAGAVLGDLGLEDQGEAMADRESIGLLEPFLDLVLL